MAFDLRAAQQALSEKYGIATFDLQGKVSTIPLTRPLNTSINVGTGSTGLTSKALNEFLAKLAPQKALVPTQPVIISGGQIIDIPKDSKLVQGEVPLEKRDIAPSISSTIQQYTPYIILGGLGLIALTLLKR